MSVIGTIGQFLIDHQDTIGTLVLVAFVLILLFLLIRLIVKNAERKKAVAERDVLIEELMKKLGSADVAPAGISNKVDIEAKVSELAVEPAEVGEPAAIIEPVIEPTAIIEPVIEPTAAIEQVIPCDDEPIVEDYMEAELQEEVAVQQQLQAMSEKVEPARAYTSRDAGVDKHGNVYTESMLMDQIG